MSTSKRRISITPDERVNNALGAIAKRRGKPVAAVSLELIERALELDEDAHFSRVADERLARGEKRVTHQRAWK